MDRNDGALAGEDERMADDQAVADAATPSASGASEASDEPFEVEHEGQVYQLPGALRGGFLRQADYTRKTQELAEHRRALAAEREAVIGHAEAMSREGSDRAHLAALDEWLDRFGATDWRSLSQQDPQRAQLLWARFQETKALRERYAYAISHHDARRELVRAQEAAARLTQTGRALQQEIEGWSPEVAAKLVEYASAFGITQDELVQAADPRFWKMLHRAFQADQAQGRQEAAAGALRGQAVRPAVTVGGAASGGGGVRDELSTKEWMARRNEHLRKAR